MLRMSVFASEVPPSRGSFLQCWVFQLESFLGMDQALAESISHVLRQQH